MDGSSEKFAPFFEIVHLCLVNRHQKWFSDELRCLQARIWAYVAFTNSG